MKKRIWSILLVLCMVLSLLPVNTFASDITIDDSSVRSFGGHSYQYFSIGMSWYEAKSCCESLGGHLVTITSQAEQNFINTFADYCMIGLSDDETEGEWKWVTGEPFAYSNWASGEPNNQGDEDYVLLNPDGTWNDGHLEQESWTFVCEWDFENWAQNDSFEPSGQADLNDPTEPSDEKPSPSPTKPTPTPPEPTPAPATPTPTKPSESPAVQRHEMLDHTYRFENMVSVVSTDIRDHVLGGVNAWWKLFDGVTNLRGTSGQCYGMAVSAAATAVFQSPSETSYRFGKKTAEVLYDITSGWTSLETKTTATNYIGYAFLFQTAPKRQLEKNLNKVEAGSINPLKKGNFEKFIQAVRSYEKTKEHPVIIEFASHAVWALGIQSNTSKKVEVVIYDCNYPGQHRVLTFFKTAHGKFSYLEYSNFDKAKNKWVPFTRSEFSFESSAVEDFIDAWDHKFQNVYTDTLYDHLLVSTSRNITIDSDTGLQGTLNPETAEEFEDLLPISIVSGSEDTSGPDFYYVSGNSELRFMVPGTEKSAQLSYASKTEGIDLTAPGNSNAIISVPENGKMRADIQTAKPDPYSISFNQTTGGKHMKTVTVSGCSSDVQTEQTEKGLEFRSNDLGAVQIALSRDGAALDLTTVQAAGNRLLITSNKDEVVVMEDLNGDGTYETPAREKTDNPFADVKADAYYYDAVAWAVNHDPVVTTGTDATHFSPGKDCTRAQMVTFLWRAAGEPKPASTKNPFKDVKKGAYYYDAVLWAVGEGITTGTGKNTFSPEAKVTRAQTVTFLWRMADEPAVKVRNPFNDVSKTAYYYNAVLWAVKNNITTGKSAKTFAPGDPCTRAQIVTFLYRDLG